MNTSIHDNSLHSYCVNADTKEIRLHTFYAHPESQEFTDVVFTGVAAYRFEGDNFMTIIFDVYETPAEKIYAENRDWFEHGRSYLWPGAWNHSEEAVLAYLIESEIKGYMLTASLGMTGWVLAKSMSLLSVLG